MNPSHERNYADPEGKQRNGAGILPLQPCRPMRTSKPPPRVHIQEQRGSNVAAANGTLRHGGYPLSSLLCRGASIASLDLSTETRNMPSKTLGAATIAASSMAAVLT